MATVQPYTLKQAQRLVKDANQRSQRRHRYWRALELLYRRGEYREELSDSDVPDILWDELPGLTLAGINMVLPNAQVVIASSFAHDPSFIVEPYSGGDQAEQEAKIGEHLLRFFWKRLKGTDIHRSMAQDMVVLGNGFCKVGWAFMEQELERDDAELNEELAALVRAEERDADLLQREPRSVDELAELLDVTEKRVVQDEPFVEYVSPYDILVPKRARRMEECRWIAQRVILPLDEVKSNSEFNDEALEELQVSFSNEDRPDKRGGEESELGTEGISDEDPEENPFAEVTLYEFYDMRTRRMMVFQEDAEHALYDDEFPYGHRHSPFVHMRNLEDGGRRFWSFGDVENVAAIQEEYNIYVEEQLASARRAGNKYIVDKTIFTPELRAMLESEQSDIAIPLELGNQHDIQQVIKAIERQSVSPEVFAAKDDLLEAMHTILGISEFQAGGTGPDRMSATAAAVVDGNSSMRAADKKWQVENAAAEAGLRILLLCQEFLDEEFALRIVDSNGVAEWLDVSSDDLTGEYGVSVHAGSTMAVNPATRMARALDLMTQIIPMLAEDGYDTHPVWRQAIRDYGMDPDRILRKMSPEEMMMQPGMAANSAGQGELPPGSQPTVPQEDMGGPPVPAATDGDMAL